MSDRLVPSPPNSPLVADVLVVGFGKGGKAAAHELANAGKSVILVERSENMYGGTCPNVGCVPTKMLVHYSSARRLEDDAQEFFANSVAGVEALTRAFRAGNFTSLDSRDNATVITGTARFVEPHTIVVGEGAHRIGVTAPTILINTGAEPVIPQVPGLASSTHLVSSTDLIRNNQLPRRLIVIGGGYLGIEFAAIYQKFGTQVTVLESSERLLGREDRDVALVAASILSEAGIDLITSATVREVRDTPATAVVEYEQDGELFTAEAEAVLVAAGRRPATADLGLEEAGVRVGPDGAIEVDDHLRTTQPHIYALGDVNGGPQFTYVSLDDSRIVLDDLLGSKVRRVSDRVAVPHTLFMTPPLAGIGMTEQTADAAGLPIRVARQYVADILAMPRAYIVEETRGVMKFVIDASTDRILGAALLSIDAQELINTVALAMRHELTAAQLRDAIYTHPSSTEAFNEVLGTIVRDDASSARKGNER